jgi:hypothetical protein
MNADDLDFVSTGICPGCAECASNLGIAVEDLASQWESGEIDEESHFSWSPCEDCGSTLGGDRHVAHGRDSNGELCHFEVCYDCFAEINGLDAEEES